MELSQNSPNFCQKMESNSFGFYALPEGCIANIVSFTSPQDACRLAVVCATFKSASDSDVVWDKFVPDGCSDFFPPYAYSSKKELFFLLAHNNFIIDDGYKSFWLDKKTAKKCYMKSARDLTIIWSNTPRYWNWVSVREARFPEVAELISVCWLEIRGRINSSMLSQNTRYAAYLVYKITAACYGLQEQPVEVEVGYEGNEPSKQTVILDAYRGSREQFNLPRRIGMGLGIARRIYRGPEKAEAGPSHVADTSNHQHPKKRDDEWYEVELGEFFNNEEDREVEMSVQEVKVGNWKGGIMIQGIEIRSKSDIYNP